MWETLQITYNNETYQFQIIKFNQLPLKFEFQILLQGVTMTICKSPMNDWEPKNQSCTICADVIKMIGKAISGKYRLSFDQADHAPTPSRQSALPVS